MDWMANPEIWIALATLTALEIVLGVDNIIFIAVLAGKLPAAQQERARLVGLLGAMFMRIGLLFSLSSLARLTTPLFGIAGQEISGRDLVLLIGGMFLLGKSTWEIHENLESHPATGVRSAPVSFVGLIVQIMLLDIVFSLDSVITAVGMANQLGVMIAAVIIALAIMLIFAGAISDFVHKHPALKMLALSFLILIGVTLVGESLGQHIPKGYIYFPMAFAFAVEMLNLKLRAKAVKPVDLHQSYH